MGALTASFPQSAADWLAVMQSPGSSLEHLALGCLAGFVIGSVGAAVLYVLLRLLYLAIR